VDNRIVGRSFAPCVAVTFIVLLCALFTPKWMTIDDLTMSMIAHGYGGTRVASHTILYSNALWGDFVRLLPEVNGILGYSQATLGVLVIVGTVLFYGLRTLGAGLGLSFGMLILLLAGPVLMPQFTINAGLLTVSAILMFHLYARDRNLATLVLGILLAFCGYLVREHEFFLVLLIALPILPWKTLIQDRAPKIAMLVLALAMAGAALYNKQVYQGAEWEHFKAFEVSRGAFSDYGAVDRLKKRPDIYEAYHYTANDLDLLENWFFDDPKIANPETMRQMLEKLGPMPLNVHSIKNTWRGIRALFKGALLPSVLSALALLLIWPNKRVAGAWLLCIAAVGLIGFMCRPAILRVYIPLVYMLCIAPLIFAPLTSDRKRMLATSVIVIAALINSVFLVIDANKTEKKMNQVKEALARFPSHPVVIWAGALPYEYLYPLVGTDPRAMSYHFYRLGTFTFDPTSVSYSEKKAGRGMIDLLISEQGVDIFAGNHQIALLSTYCREHFAGTLKISNSQAYPELSRGVSLANYRCET